MNDVDTELKRLFDRVHDARDGEHWHNRALCAQSDPEAFFPTKGGSSREAKKICARCPVREQCLDFAMKHEEHHGIWGGLTERDRRQIRREAYERGMAS